MAMAAAWTPGAVVGLWLEGYRSIWVQRYRIVGLQGCRIMGSSGYNENPRMLLCLSYCYA